MHKLVVNLTTIYSRLSCVHLVIKSLLTQDFPNNAYEVRLYLSKQSYLLDEGCATITNDLRNLQKEYPNKFFIEYVTNTGSYRKIIPVLNEVYKQSPSEFYNTLIVTADDDTAYPPSWLWQLYENYLKHRCVIGFRGRVMGFDEDRLIPYKKWSKKVTSNPSNYNVPTGKDGVLYSPLDLHPSVRNINMAQKYAPKADDLWLKAHSLLLGVPSFIINETLNKEFSSITNNISQASQMSLYRKFNELGGNDEALISIGNYLKRTRNTSWKSLCVPSQMNSSYLEREIADVLRGVS